MISNRAMQWLRLAMVRGVGPLLGRKLIQSLGSIDAVWQQSESSLRQLPGIGPQLIAALTQSRAEHIADVIELCETQQIALLCPEDDQWPALLSPLDDVPLVLFVQGDVSSLNGEQTLAVIGARKASREGCVITRRWCHYLSDHHISIVSGMAYGIDAAAHRGALQGCSPTIAVLGCGLAALTELQTQQVQAVAAQGCVVSEFLPLTTARPENFPRRNRIIAGLSHATLVMEADVRSGSLITAKQALEYGRELLAVPGSVLGDNHAGCHQLIRDGSLLIAQPDDILSAMSWQSGSATSKHRKSYHAADADESKILQALAIENMHLDHLAESSGLTVPELSPILLRLELQGVIERLPGSRYLLSVELDQT
ncbi:MAG: DNA-processing protein DprA [Mariprofundus sp.]|nr:DNA-processing protein DprA [Mariprofundus sp.]